MSNLIDIVDNFKNKNVLVIGDVMLDSYVFGKVTRISPEAPIPIVDVEDDKTMNIPGGAANTASNIKSLGGEVYLVGITGVDNDADLLNNALRARRISLDGLVDCPDKPTTVKTRIVADQQQVVRMDREKRGYIDDYHARVICDRFNDTIDSCNVVVVSDYAKGVITPYVMDNILKVSRMHNTPVIVDPRPQNMDSYKNCDIITPNIAEAEGMVGKFDMATLCIKILSKLNCNVLLTKGKEGMTLCTKNMVYTDFDAITKGVRDVTGAGDTVAAALALSLAAGASYEQAAEISNYAAGIVVGKFGTTTTTREELINVIKNYKP